MPIKVAVQGALGQMGQEVIRAVGAASDLVLVGGCDSKAVAPFISSSDGNKIPLCSDLATLLADCQPDVVIDFSLAAAVQKTAETAAKAGVSLVIGTTGLAPEALSKVAALTKEYNIGAVIAPNFALGAVVMMELARIAARYFDWAEIIELHHEKKADAPSGTAIATARAMSSARELPFQNLPGDNGHASRGQKFDGVPIHSVRMPGLVANQEIIFGAPGQTLSIKHDTINRESFMPGVLMAIREVVKRPGQFIFGLDKLLGL
ncbi:dihydrodipicolinate reductase [Dehalogenimonas sp. WBC-2]|nr:dihydrodipicolinate reductase [Dehalogenimonas sp. WBC-2]